MILGTWNESGTGSGINLGRNWDQTGQTETENDTETETGTGQTETNQEHAGTWDESDHQMRNKPCMNLERSLDDLG